MNKLYIILLSLFVSIFAQGQSVNNIKLTIMGDSVILKGREAQIKVKIENKSKKSIFIYTDFISLVVYNNIDKALSDCLLDEDGRELFLHLKRGDSKIKLKSHSVFTTTSHVDFNTLCWRYNIDNIKEFYVMAEYYDIKLRELFYSEPILVTIR
jgi:hypothetical protein